MSLLHYYYTIIIIAIIIITIIIIIIIIITITVSFADFPHRGDSIACLARARPVRSSRRGEPMGRIRRPRLAVERAGKLSGSDVSNTLAFNIV